MNVGILVHGRHLQAINWERLMWGEPPYKLGSLPMAVLTILNRGQENVKAIVFGTGASERNGLKEAEYTKEFLLQNKQNLQEFDVLKNHPRLKSARDFVAFRNHLDEIICELDSQNTIEEIRNAAKIFVQREVQEVVQVTCSSHAPRCIKDAAVVQEQGFIPVNQCWSVVRDHMAYAGTRAGDVVVVEPPHRGDDPMVNAEYQPYKIFPKIFSIKDVGLKQEVLEVVDGIFTQSALEDKEVK